MIAETLTPHGFIELFDFSVSTNDFLVQVEQKYGKKLRFECARFLLGGKSSTLCNATKLFKKLSVLMRVIRR